MRSIALVAREAADAVMRRDVADHGAEGTVRRALVESWRDAAASENLAALSAALRRGELKAVSLIAGLPFGTREPEDQAPPNDASWLLDAAGEAQALALLGLQPAPAAGAAAPAKRAAPDWQAQARDEARRIRAERAAKGLFPNLAMLGDEVARVFRERGITGPNGHPLGGPYIKRHALQRHGITSKADRLRATLNARGK